MRARPPFTCRVAAWTVGLAGLASPAFGAGTVQKLTDHDSSIHGPPAIVDDGSTVWARSNTDQHGGNPEGAPQAMSFDSSTGSLRQATALPRGVFSRVSISDDGAWIAFSSSSDPLGANHDQSEELFVMRDDGSGLAQLTSDARPDAGSVLDVRISGSANRVVLLSNSDPLGTNADGGLEIFVVDRDGSNLIQLTDSTANAARLGDISDDGGRITFAYSDALTEPSPSGRLQVYGIEADGTNLHKLAGGTDFDSGSPVISGDGGTVALVSRSDLLGLNPGHEARLFSVDWGGANLRALGEARSSDHQVSITDDGATVVFSSNQASGSYNTGSWNAEIWRIQSDGSGLTPVTADTASGISNLHAVVSGDGSKVAFHVSGGTYPGVAGDNADGNTEIMALGIDGADPVQLTDTLYHGAGTAEITPDGNHIVLSASDGIYKMGGDGSGLTRVTDFPGYLPRISGDGSKIAFMSYEDPLGTNADRTEELFSVDAGGSNLRQLTADDFESHDPDMATNGSFIVYESARFEFGIPVARDIFALRPDGSDGRRLTTCPLNTNCWSPRVDGSGAWVTFYSFADVGGQNPGNDFAVYRVTIDGMGLQRISPVGFDGLEPDISGDGTRIAYRMAGDPLGTNPDGNAEIVLYDTTTATTRQLTDTTSVTNTDPRITEDGTVVFFTQRPGSQFEADPDDPDDVMQVEVATGLVTRTGSRRMNHQRNVRVSGNADGSVAVLSGPGDWTDDNPDGGGEVWLVDRTNPAALRVDGKTGTVVTWDHEAGSLRYDVIRGDVSALAPGAPGTTDLGAVSCIEDESPDATTAGFEDATVPSSGQVLFYLFRGTRGLLDGPGSYGRSSAGDERLAASGDCPG